MTRRRYRKGSSPLSKRPIIALLTDFGLSDSYVAEMKAVLYRDRARPDLTIVDVTHAIPSQDVLSASFTLERALRAFPRDTLHLAIVDPGVGSHRRILLARINDQLVLVPDNGLITWPFLRLPVQGVHELIWRPDHPPSRTFHGRDIFAPAATLLATGTPVAQLAVPIRDPVLLPIRPAPAHPTSGLILHFDHFGNAATNVPAEALTTPPRFVRVGRRRFPLSRTYADVPDGRPVALIGSAGLLEIAVRNGSAAAELNLRVGMPVTILY